MAKGKKTGGRVAGVPNKATREVREAAQQYTEQALQTLAEILVDKEQPAAARVSAAKELLDRAHGKSTQPLAGDPHGPPIGIASHELHADLDAIDPGRARELIEKYLG